MSMPTTNIKPTKAQIAAFKRAWAEADARGKKGHRVEAGLLAALNADALDELAPGFYVTSNNAHSGGSVNEGAVLMRKHRDGYWTIETAVGYQHDSEEAIRSRILDWFEGNGLTRVHLRAGLEEF
ncbi:hypothetical protein QDW22_gp57 [Microbacterium Phage DirtyBubble]|uniref:hypothetical protein n=1 Tax=Microbacterium Phage DirtyBubble TaxID=2590932 RepID=UPI00118976B7|nr:hypothetical protein QDW22_gp57 [Microbacterium Phage DirtyBubble]QDP45075.1 hypothetical protein DIRTYBUBBLE_57 [Microbacterium Phage DirtyBubble]